MHSWTLRVPLAERIDELREAAGVHAKLRYFGISKGTFPDLADEAARQWTGAFNPRKLDKADFLKIYEEAF